jgi:hypothetical protein
MALSSAIDVHKHGEMLTEQHNAAGRGWSSVIAVISLDLTCMQCLEALTFMVMMLFWL